MKPELNQHLEFLPKRKDPAAVDEAFSKLGVTPGECFCDYYRTFEGGPIGSDYVGFTLSDMIEDRASVVNLTIACRDNHGFAPQFLVISDLCADSVLVYDSVSDGVLDVDFEGGSDQLMKGTLEPQWASFQSFLEFFFLGN
jgi:hypothetical protein